ncbi:uncharacterized protein LOC118506990 [Anopheles stephensi]|uniref:uncharacterized protein LOC118506990 n=1 Tax=Anopheles stephensi TaxID=30069 RepID=UPI001658716A|nr:uncharacterized protein LOC118506990 [Anopheles stephensi]
MQDSRTSRRGEKKRNKPPAQAPQQDGNPVHEQTHRIINDLPITPTMFDGTYPAYEDFTTTLVSESSVSELSFSSESPDSDTTVHHRTADPIVELPSTPLRDGVESRECVACETISPGTIGTALGSGTVLMQRSLENRLAKQLEQMHALMDDNDEEQQLVVLKQPSIRSMASHPAFNKELMRGFMEHSETMFSLVHDTNGNSNAANSVQFVIGIEEEAATDTEAPGCSHRPARRSIVVPTVTDGSQESEFIGCFSKDNDMVLYKRTMPEGLKTEHDDRQSIETLIAHHAECLVEADNVTKPRVHVRQGNDENLLALLTFSDQSSAILKTSSAMAEAVETEEELNQAILTTYRQLLAKPDEMISMQTQAASGRKQYGLETATPIHTHQLRADAMDNLSTATSSFGLSNESPVGMVVQGSSKNWIKCPATQHAAEIVLNLRLLLEEYILRNISVTGTVLKFVSHVLSDVLQCAQQDIGQEFRQLGLVDKIKRVLDELLMPQELEDPVRIVNRLQYTIEEIRSYPIGARTVMNDEDAWNCVLRMLEKLSCELDHEIEQPERFVEALQYGIRRVMDASTVRTDQQAPNVVSIDPSPVQQHSAFPSTSSILAIDRYEAPSVSFCRPYTCFVERILLCVWSALVWIVNQMNSFWNFLNAPPPPLLSDPSATFKRYTEDDEQLHGQQTDREQLNEVKNVLRIALEKSSARAAENDDSNRSVNDRSLEMFAQLLNHAGNIELKHSDSHHNIRLQLHTSISGVLEKREADEYMTMAGNIRDHEANVAVFFEARIIALESLAEVESFMECVTRIERLSDEVDGCSDELSDETVIHAPSGTHRHDDGELVVSELIHDMVANGHYEQQLQALSSLDAEQLLQEIKHCLQDLLAPVTTAVHKIFEQFARDEVESTSVTGPAEELDPRNGVKTEEPGTSSENEAEIQDESVEEVTNPVLLTDDSNEDQLVEMRTSVVKAGATESQLSESLQELLALFHVTNDRLALIDTDITAIRNQVQQLVAGQQYQQGPPEGTNPIQTEERRSRRKSSVKHAQTPSAAPLAQCPLQRKPIALCGSGGAYCPTEIYSCHAVAPDVLVIHWRVLDESVLHCITGFEIYVDDRLRSMCYSNKRRTALIGNIDLQKHHHITLHVTSQPDTDGGTCQRAAQWAPAFFLYHT